MKQYDVIIIGGGLSGAAVLFNLAHFGLKVALCERGNLASGATGRNGGQVIQLDGRDRDTAAILKRLRYSKNTVSLLTEYERILDYDFQFRQVGSLDIAATEQEATHLLELCRLQRESGDVDVEFLDHKALHEVSPYLADYFPGARFRHSDGNLYPFNLALGLVKQSMELGADVFTGCDVRRVVIQNGSVCGVETDGDRFIADRVVLATSAWTKDLFPDFAVIPLRSHAALSEEIPKIDAPAFEVVLDDEIIYGSTQFENGHILLGGGPDRPRTAYEQYDYCMSWQDLMKNASLMARVFPPLGNIHIMRCWAGTMGTTPDGLPFVGATEMATGLFLITGFPNGMAFIPYIAKLLSQMVAEKEMDMDLEPFNPDRYLGVDMNIPEQYNYTILADYLGRM
jgi:sarcosine oxidase subunit beta